ncbi:MAG: hypothetical protein H6R01_527 [Burkholderiaceae bacterium]|nr:hypothetical protein [Burkholderiaceae bacterium]
MSPQGCFYTAGSIFNVPQKYWGSCLFLRYTPMFFDKNQGF